MLQLILRHLFCQAKVGYLDKRRFVLPGGTLYQNVFQLQVSVAYVAAQDCMFKSNAPQVSCNEEHKGPYNTLVGNSGDTPTRP